MAKVRNVGPRRVSVPLLRREVDPDEVVEVPDQWLETYVWPAATWAVVAAPKRAAKTSTEQDGE